MSKWTDTQRRRKWRDRLCTGGIITGLVVVLVLVMSVTCGCIPSTAGPSPRRDNVATAGKPSPKVTVTITEIKPNEKATGGAGNEVRKGAETGVPFVADMLKGGKGTVADLLPITAVIKLAHVIEAFFDKVSKAQVTTVTVVIEGVVPKKLDAKPSGVTAEWPDGEAVDAAPKATPASLDGPFSSPALLRSDTR